MKLKKLMLLIALLSIILIFISCGDNSNQNKANIKLKNNIISNNKPLNIMTDFKYSKVIAKISGIDLSFDSTSTDLTINGLKEGNYSMELKFFGKEERFITNYITDFYFDNTKPTLKNYKYTIKFGTAFVSLNIPDKDFKMVSVYKNKNFIVSSDSKNFSVLVDKNNVMEEFQLLIYDTVNNFSTYSLKINTDKDDVPIILTPELRVDLFSNTHLNISDDWDSNLQLFIESDNKYLYPYELLSYNNSSESTTTIVDSGNNYLTRKLNIITDSSIPEKLTFAQKLIPHEQTRVFWNDVAVDSKYILEGYDYIQGWKEATTTTYNFVNSLPDTLDLLFVRKVAKGGTKGFPSEPTIRFSDTLTFLSNDDSEKSVIEIKQNSELPQISSPYFVSNRDIIINEGKTLFIESGSEIRYFSSSAQQSRFIVKGIMFIRPGAGRTKLFSNGEIFVDGGILIVSATDFNNIKITGRNAKLIYIENSTFTDNSNIDLKNSGRVCFYNVKAPLSTTNIENSLGLFIDKSNFSDLSTKNISEFLLANTNINKFSLTFNSKCVMQESDISSVFIDELSYLNSINSKIQNLSVNNFSVFVNSKSQVGNLTNNLGTITGR